MRVFFVSATQFPLCLLHSLKMEVGKQADRVIWNAPDFEMVCYRLGSNLVGRVIKKGELVVG